jgi:CIC family chloride channel protein
MSAAPSADDHLGDFTTDRRVLTLTLMAVFIGLISAVVAYLMVWLIAAITNLAFYHRLSVAFVSPARNALGAWEIVVPIVGAIAIGLMARYGSEKIRGHGIPEAMEAILIGHSRIDAKVAILKPLSSAISIGTGGPFGAEGPIIMTGGAFGSLFAQFFHLSAAERKTLLVAGAAGGMAAIFASPVASVLLAVELLLFEWKPRSFIPVATAAATAAALRVPLLGRGPIFPVPPHADLSWQRLLLCLLVGLAAGFVSGLLTALVYGCEDIFGRLPIHWMWWPPIGALVVGVGGLLYPRALGVGYDTIQALLAGQLSGGGLAGLLITKMLIWSVALGSGTSGGVLAPLLIMGGSLGVLEAGWLHLGSPGLWALISMGAMMGGTMRSPFTAVIFVLELTRDVAMLPGLLIACVAADLVTVLVMKRSILTEKVARHGHHVVREYAVNPLQIRFVGDVMLTEPPQIPADMKVADLVDRLTRLEPALSPYQAWPMVDEAGRLVGMVTRGDLLESLKNEKTGEQRVREIGSRSLIVAYPDELLIDAVTKMARHDVGRLPVVSRDDPNRLVGYLGRTGIMAAWARGIDEEVSRESGWLTSRIRLLRNKARMRLRRAG